MGMDTEAVARAAGATRAAIGVALLAAPGPAAKRWLGDVSERPGAKVAIGGLGARDVVLGVGTVWALGGRKRDVRPWLIASGAADIADFVGTLRSREGLTTESVIATLAIAGGSAVLFGWLQSELG
jgi:hypothetical protein